ncbi:unnamed protein product, partial [Brassica oleracea]
MAPEESFAACLAERTGKSRVFNILFMGSPTRKSGIEYTLKKLLQLTTNEEAFDALKTKTVDLVLTAHSTQFVPNVLKICRTLPSP